MTDFSPRPHQELALQFLREHDKGCLFLEMGLGKTVVTLTRINELLYDEFAAHKFLVIAPKRVAEDTWSRECNKWSHLQGLRVSKVLGAEADRKLAMETEAEIYVINRENVMWLADYLGRRMLEFDGLVIDELSSFKSASSKRWKVLKKFAPTFKYVWGLTGTPAPNGYMDLWPELYLIDQGHRLGRTLTEYRSTYFRAGASNGHVVYQWIMLPHAKTRIDRKLRDICLSMSTEDWVSLPDRIYNVITVHLDPQSRKRYEQLKRDKVLPILEQKLAEGEDMDSAIVGDTAAALSNKLLQMANGAVYDEAGEVIHIHDAKLDALEEIVETAKTALIFYSYKHDLDRIRAKFPDAVTLDEPDAIARWNRGEIKMLLAHPMSAGHGLNLQEGGHIVVWFGLPWSLEAYQQANKRLHRMGQTETVIIHHIVAAGTVDEKVMAVLGRKDAVQKGLLDALKDYMREVVD